VCDHQGSDVAGAAGEAYRLDYYYGPKHNPTYVLGSPLPEAASIPPQPDLLNKKWPQQLKSSKPAGLLPIEACFMTMASLRLGIGVKETSSLFGISEGSVSQIRATWIPYISNSLDLWTPWPTQDQVRASIPTKFKAKLAATTHSRKCLIILDCTEIFIARPEDDELAKLHYSSYKKHYTTMKWLVGITPCGSISFVSAGYSGSTTDDEICKHCGFYGMLQRCDAVIADRGFTEFATLRDLGCELIIPALSQTMGKGHGTERAGMTVDENIRTYHIAQVRIHIERMMRLIKGGWHCFDALLPTQMLPLYSRYILNIAAKLTAFGLPLQGVDYLFE